MALVALLGTLLLISIFFTVLIQGFNIKKQCGWDFVKTILFIWQYQFGVAGSALWHTSYLSSTAYKAWIMISLGVNLRGKCDSQSVKLLSRVRLFAVPKTVAYQAPSSMEFSRQEYWSGWPFPSPGDLPNLGIEPRSPALQADALPSELRGVNA